MNEDTLLPDAKNPLIWINPGRVSGAPCFYKSRVPVSSLVENLDGGVSLEDWLDAFPPITREQALAVLEYVRGDGRHLLSQRAGRAVKTNKSDRKHERYRRFGAQTFAEADAELRDYWWSRTPEERMEALEELRIRVYGEEKINARIPRVFGVPEPRRS